MRFLAVGVVNTAFGYGLFALLYLASGSYRLAIVVATVAGVIFNFITTGRLVFSSSRPGALLPFALVYVLILIVNVAILDLSASFGLNPLLGQVIAMPIMVGLAYILNARLVFRGPK